MPGDATGGELCPCWSYWPSAEVYQELRQHQWRKWQLVINALPLYHIIFLVNKHWASVDLLSISLFLYTTVLKAMKELNFSVLFACLFFTRNNFHWFEKRLQYCHVTQVGKSYSTWWDSYIYTAFFSTTRIFAWCSFPYWLQFGCRSSIIKSSVLVLAVMVTLPAPVVVISLGLLRAPSPFVV